MSSISFGERYFSSCKQLAHLQNDIAALSRETGAHLQRELSDHQLDSPFTFAVWGETNAGKSSFLNSLFRHELCKTASLPETDRFILYRHGSEDRIKKLGKNLDECTLPLDFLMHFNLIDSPGSNSIIIEQDDNSLEFLQSADLIFFIFSVTNPWCASTWNLITNLSEVSRQNAVFIIQQCDKREVVDLEVILEHMTELSIKRLGRKAPIFPVSSNSVSGFPMVEKFINQYINRSEAHRLMFFKAIGDTELALRSIQLKIEDLTKNLNAQHYFLESLEQEINTMREGVIAKLPEHLISIAQICEKKGSIVTQSLSKRLGYIRSVYRIFIGDRGGYHTQSVLIARLRETMEEIATSDGEDLMRSCKNHWKELDTRVEEAIGLGIEGCASIDEKLQDAKQLFLKRIGSAARMAIGNLHIRKELEKNLRIRNNLLKSLTRCILILVILGAGCGIIQLPWFHIIFCSLAGTLIIWSYFIATITSEKICHDFDKSLADIYSTFALALKDDYREALRVFYQDYNGCLGSIHRHIANEKIAVEPKFRQWHDMFVRLKSIEHNF